MTLVSSLGVPFLGVRAPLVASALAVTIVVAGAVVLLAPLLGVVSTTAFVVVLLANPLFSQWLIQLTTDGLGIALLFLVTAFLARYIADGNRRWLGGATAAGLVLAFTRQSGAILPPAMVVGAVVALAGGGPWRRFAAAAVALVVPLLVVAGYAAVSGLPSFADMLQDVPTLHYVRPDVANIIGYLLAQDLEVGIAVVRTIPGQAWVWIAVLLSAAGFIARRRWWLLPFVVVGCATPLLLAVHPVLTEADRTLAPAWLTISVGLALLPQVVLDRSRERVTAASG